MPTHVDPQASCRRRGPAKGPVGITSGFALAVGLSMLTLPGCDQRTVTPAEDGNTRPAIAEFAQTEPAEQQRHPAIGAAIQAAEAQNFEEALAKLGEVPREDPSFSIALSTRSEILRRQGDFSGARADLDTLRSLNADDPGIYFGLSRLAYGEANFDTAEVEVLRAIEIDPRAPRPRYFLGLIRTAAGRPEAAVSTYTRAIRLDPNGTFVTQAFQELSALTAAQKDRPAPLYLLAFFGRTMGDEALEIRSLERLLEVNPEGQLADVARKNLERARKAD